MIRYVITMGMPLPFYQWLLMTYYIDIIFIFIDLTCLREPGGLLVEGWEEVCLGFFLRINWKKRLSHFFSWLPIAIGTWEHSGTGNPFLLRFFVVKYLFVSLNHFMILLLLSVLLWFWSIFFLCQSMINF